MKFRKFGQITLALAVSLGMGLGVTSCSTDHTVGYFWVTGAQYNQISGFKIDNNVGNLTATPSSPYGSGGYDPIKVVVANAGKFLYVLNAGCGGTGQTACPSAVAADNTGPNISLFTVGGQGSLSFQATYTSQGNNPISIQTDSSGAHLFVLDSTVPDPTTCKGYVSSNPATICGDITAFNIDPNTGRLSLITNQTVKNWEWHKPVVLSGGELTDQLCRGSEQLVHLHHRKGQRERDRSLSGSLRVREQQWPADPDAEYSHPQRGGGS